MTTPAFACPLPPPPRVARVAIPQGACDSHAHVFGSVERYPYTTDAHYRPPDRAYVPPPVTVDDYIGHLAALGLRRGVLVQANMYGIDHRCLVDALARLRGRARGIAVLPFSVADSALRDLDRAGIRGVRFHGVGAQEFGALRDFAERLAALGWHIQIFAPLAWVAAHAEVLAAFPCPVVFDHFAGLKAEAPTSDDDFGKVLRLVAEGPGWVKLSAPFRATAASMPYETLAARARMLAGAAPHRLVWGSDWPYLRMAQPLPQGGDLLDALATWLPDADLRRAVLCENPKVLYGFEDEPRLGRNS